MRESLHASGNFIPPMISYVLGRLGPTDSILGFSIPKPRFFARTSGPSLVLLVAGTFTAFRTR